MSDTMRIVRLTQVRLTRAQAHRLIETYGCGDVPREDALERVTEATVTAYDAPRGDRVELDTNVSGEPVSWLAQDEIDRLLFDTESTPPPGGCPRSRRRPTATPSAQTPARGNDCGAKATSSPRPTATIRRCPGAAGGSVWPASRPLDFAAECPRRVTWRADDPHRQTHPRPGAPPHRDVRIHRAARAGPYPVDGCRAVHLRHPGPQPP